MKTLAKLTTALTNKALGTVDAGACIVDMGCCCSVGPRYALDCYGYCVTRPCSTRQSTGQPCYT
jgi:hypothetical protein